MTLPSSDSLEQRIARLAGLLYLVIITCGIWSEGVARASLVVPGDAAATAGNIQASTGLFRMALAADTLMLLCDVALAVLLYLLFRPVGRTLALMAMAFRLVQSAVLGMNLLNHAAALLVLDRTAPGAVFLPDQGNALALLFLELHSHGYDAGLLFFGVNCLLIGWLIIRSQQFPALLGPLIAGAGVVYLTGSYLRFLAPDMADAFAPAYLLPLIAETSFCLWLIVRGVNNGRGGTYLPATR